MTLTELVEQWRSHPDELSAEHCAGELDDYIKHHFGEVIT